MKKTIFNRPLIIHTVSVFIFLVALAPVWGFLYFPTVDGPAHLYNARIIRELLWGDAIIYAPFFNFNQELVPNWTGHLIAVVTGVVLPVWLVEKITVLLIVAGVPAGIYSLSRAFGALPSWQLLFLLPFLYTITLYLGFFNFMLALALMFFTLSWMVRWEELKYPFPKLILVTTLLYFTHVLAFAIALIFVCCYLSWNSIVSGKKTLFTRNNFLRLLCFLPGLILTSRFFSSRNMEGFRNQTEQLPIGTLLKWLDEGAAFVGLNGAEEVPYTAVFMKAIVILILIAGVYRIRKKLFRNTADCLLIFSFLMMGLYFIIPDGMASGGFISLRILLIALAFAATWLLTVNFPAWISLAAALTGIYVSFSTFSYRMEVAAQLNSDATNYIEVAAAIPSGSVVLPLNYSQNWLHTNLSGYAGATNNLVLLDNYEAVLEEFPLRWNRDTKPGNLAGNFTQSLNPVIDIANYEVATGVKIDYVIRWVYNQSSKDPVSTKTDSLLRMYYQDTKKIGRGDLFYNRKQEEM
ncbi:MAG: hypothetical protein M3Q95_14125 [Bacteroidota bacterium]|nr:hypothetical protein [Bacteroidota bacterium]